ncbi:ErfK/SrfK protein [Geomicrobium sp. JCM 19039]|nr:L,D-transpeptidase [Geomicrobium sp. JCM 19039]GAK12826.1 ErfK/SrfK protein [Geomicrobium sp. JCM 19039]
MNVLLIITVLMSSLWPMDVPPEQGDPYIIVNKASNEVGWINDGNVQDVFPAATGRTKDLTPEGEFTLIVKAKDPYYRKLDIEGGSKDNPLGSRWLGFDAKGTDGRMYGIHGTNEPEKISEYVSNGCIRLRNDDVIRLFDQAPVGTRVWVGAEQHKSIATIAGELNLLYE